MIGDAYVAVVLPAYNAEKTLERTVQSLDRSIVDSIILVDDASQDRTVALAPQLGLLVHRHEANRGYGANQKTCYAFALEQGADIVVMLHPDYQYDPRLVPVMAYMIHSGIYDVGPRLAHFGQGRFNRRHAMDQICGQPLSDRLPKPDDQREALRVPYGLSRLFPRRSRKPAAFPALRATSPKLHRLRYDEPSPMDFT